MVMPCSSVWEVSFIQFFTHTRFTMVEIFEIMLRLRSAGTLRRQHLAVPVAFPDELKNKHY